MKLLKCALALLVIVPIGLARSAITIQRQCGERPRNGPTIYHVFMVKAALGKAKELQDWFKQPDPEHPKAKGIVLRHQDGDTWDFIAIEHMGTKATVDLKGPPMTPQQRLMSEWHADTFVGGPSWADFCKALGLEDREERRRGLCRFRLSSGAWAP